MRQSQSQPSNSVMCRMLYEIFLQPRAEKELRILRKRAKVRYEKIMERLQELAKDPKNESIPLQDAYFFGLRRMKAGEDRVKFQICEECKSNPTISGLRQCVDCNDIPENGIKVFDVMHRSSSYKKRRR